MPHIEEIGNQLPMKAETAEVATVAPTDLLSAIATAVADPRMDVDKMAKLLDMHERITKDQQRVAFAAALSRLQAKLPQIRKDGRIVVKGVERSRYAKLEDIDIVIRPLLDEEGFAFSFDSKSTDGKLFDLSCTLSHKEGHSVTKSLLLPMDRSDYRSDVQSIGSTVSYGKRQLIKMHLNLIERDEDDDGNGGNDPIDRDQIKAIGVLLDKTEANLKGFLDYMGVDEIKDIPVRDYKRAINALESKLRGRK